jgi:hypothetical protein
VNIQSYDVNSMMQTPFILIVLSFVLPATMAASWSSPSALFAGMSIRHFDDYKMEIAGLVACVLILVVAVGGQILNERLALVHGQALLREDGALRRNFAQVDATLARDGPALFKVYASGRRHCQGALISLRMKKRHDMAGLLAFSAFSPDVIDIEVIMNSGAMPPTVLFIATPEYSRSATSDGRDDVINYARRFDPARDRLPNWPPLDQVLVLAEHGQVFYDVITPTVMEAFFGPNAFPEVKPYFRSLHISSEYKVAEKSKSRPVVRISAVLPPSHKSEIVLDRLVSLAGLVVDGLAVCKFSPEQLKKSEEARIKAEMSSADRTESQKKRAEEKKAAKEAEEKVRLARLPPEKREKELARKERIQRERRIRSMAKRV